MASIRFFFSHHLLRLVCDCTCYVIFIMRLWLIMRNFREKVLMKLNAPIDFFSKGQEIFDPVSQEFSLDLICRFFVG